MMHVPVHNHDTLETIEATRVVGGNYRIIKDTESHRPVARSMMPRRTQKRIDISHFAVHYGLYCIDSSSCRVDGSIVRAAAERSIALDLSPVTFHRTALNMRAHPGYIFASMKHGEFIFRSGSGGN